MIIVAFLYQSMFGLIDQLKYIKPRTTSSVDMLLSGQQILALTSIKVPMSLYIFPTM